MGVWAQDKTLLFAFDSSAKDEITANSYTNSYLFHRWTVSNDDVSIYMGGKIAVQSKMMAMRYANSRNGEMLGNIDPEYDATKNYTIPENVTGAIPGRIKKISVKCGGTTTRGIYIYAGTSQIVGDETVPTGTDFYTVKSEKLTGTEVSVEYGDDTNYTYFAITGANSSYSAISEFTITYEGESGPSITASDVTYAADITSGEIPYIINNPVEGTNLTASTAAEWIQNVSVDAAGGKVTFGMSENTEAAPRTGTITLAYGDILTKDVTVTQNGAVAKRTVTIETPENGTLKIFRGEEEVVSGSLIPQGTELRAEVTPDEGYKFRNWQAVDATTHTYTTNFTYTVGESDVTFSANFDKIIYHTITWSVNGVETTSNVEEGTDITFVAPTENIPEGYVFKGWYGSTLEPQDNAPEYVTSATATADITYYAVFAKGEGSEPSLVKMTMNDDIIDGDKVVVVAKVDETTSYGLYQETIGGSYVKNFLFTNKVEDVALDDKKWWTVSDGTSANDGKWKLGDEINGYLNNSGSNNLNVDVAGTSEWTFEKDENSGLFKIKGGSTNRYLSCRSDLTGGENLYRYRMAGSSPVGIYTFDIYKYVSGSVVYSDFRTSVTAPTTATISIAEACTDGNGMYYGTYSSSKAFVVPGDIEVSEISIIDNKLLVDSYSTGAVVPANTGVMVSSMTAGEHKVTLSEEKGTSVLGEDNMLRPTGDNGVTAAEMAANDADSKYYRLTMHRGVTLGFFWGAAEGAAFDVAANKAYLAVPAAQAAKVAGFAIDGGGTTAIESIENGNGAEVSRKVYNLQGQRVSGALPKGLYIIDGRKVIVK